MKVVIAVPPIEDFYFTPHRFSCLGARCIEAELKRLGISTEFLNFPPLKSRQLALPKDMAYLKEFMIEGEIGGLSFFTRYRHFGPSYEECVRQILAARPDILFLSCFAFCFADQTIRLAEEIKKEAPDLPIVAGGGGVTVFPGYFLESGAVDLAYAGEGEGSLQGILEAVRGERETFTVQGLHKKGERFAGRGRCTSGDLLPVWSLTRKTRKSLFISLMLTRGCKKKCRFCVNHNNDDFKVLPLDKVERIIKEIALLAGDKEVRINFEDDNLLQTREYFFSVLQMFRRAFGRVSFYSENGTDYTLLDDQTLNALIDLGFKQFNLSLGSLDSGQLKSQQRGINLERYLRVIGTLEKREIPSITYFICGFPGESKEAVAETLAFLGGQKTLTGISLFYPIPGIPGFEETAVFEAKSSSLCLGGAAYPWNSSFTTGQLITAFRLSRLSNLLKQKILTHEDQVLIEKIFREKKLFSLQKRGKERKIIPLPGLDRRLVDLFFEKVSVFSLKNS